MMVNMLFLVFTSAFLLMLKWPVIMSRGSMRIGRTLQYFSSVVTTAYTCWNNASAAPEWKLREWEKEGHTFACKLCVIQRTSYDKVLYLIDLIVILIAWG